MAERSGGQQENEKRSSAEGGMFDSDSDPNAHLSSEEGEAT